MCAELDVVPPGAEEGLEAAWRLKEAIRREEGIFHQERPFFERAYREAAVYRLLDESGEETGNDGRAGAGGEDGTRQGDDGWNGLLGFAAVRPDGYLLFLAVAPSARGRGLGRRLVEAAAADHPAITCHVRSTNEAAIGFYEHVGFEEVRRVARYYRDGTNARFLRYDSGESPA